MGLGYEKDTYPIGDIDVSRSAFPGFGYEWTVTFVSDDNAGDMPPFFGYSFDKTKGVVDVLELQPGSRVGGHSEKQLIQVTTDNCQVATVEGFFRLSFNGTATFTPWLAMDATAADVEEALGTLMSLRGVSVTKSDILVSPSCTTPGDLDTRQ